MGVNITPNMNLPSPIPGNEPGVQYAIDNQSCLTLIDQHDHTTGKGVPLTPASLSITTDLPFNDNNATLLRSVRFSPQSAVLTLPADVGCLYVVNNELYYNDVTGGHTIQMTLNGAVVGTPGSINGLPSGTASASFVAGTFIWQASTNTAANMDAGSYIFRNNTANSHGLTLQPPAAMGANYSVTLPTIPGSTSFVTIDTSGNLAGTNAIVGGITRGNLVAVGQQISSSCGQFTTVSTSFVDVTNLSVTITTTGRPVIVMLMPVGSFNGTDYASVSAIQTDNTNGGIIRFVRGVTTISDIGVLQSSVNNYNGLTFIDTPTAGTYTYKVRATNISSSNNVIVNNYSLAVYEL